MRQTPSAIDHDRIGSVVEENVAHGGASAWADGLLLVAGQPVAVSADVEAAAAAHIAEPVQRYLVWKVDVVYGAYLTEVFGPDDAEDLMAEAVDQAMADLEDNWLRYERNLLTFLRSPDDVLALAKRQAWSRARRAVHAELRRIDTGAGWLGDLRPEPEAWRVVNRRSWSGRAARGADVCFLETEDLVARRCRESDVRRLVAERLSEDEAVPVRPRAPRERH